MGLSSNFARRGANPGSEISWPIVVEGGQGPYAISIDWGDSSPDTLLSVQIPGEFTVNHAYESSGTYRIIVKATDSAGRTGYLQLVGVGNGALESVSETGSQLQTNTVIQTRVVWQPVLILIPLIVSTFWLGKRYQLKRIKDKIQKGELPFNLS